MFMVRIPCNSVAKTAQVVADEIAKVGRQNGILVTTSARYVPNVRVEILVMLSPGWESEEVKMMDLVSEVFPSAKVTR